MNRRQSIAVPSGTNKENGTRVARIKRAQSIGGPMDIRKGSSIGADGLSPRRRKRRSMVSTRYTLPSHKKDMLIYTFHLGPTQIYLEGA